MTPAESELRRMFYLLGSLTLLGVLVYWARPVMILVTIAVLMTFVLTPLVSRLERWGIPRFVASSLAVLGAAILLVGIVHVFIMQTTSLTSELPAYKTQLSAKIGEVRKATAKSWIVEFMDFADDLTRIPPDDPGMEKKGDPIGAKMEVPWGSMLQSLVGTFVELFIGIVVAFILALMMLMRREDLRNRMIHLLGTNNNMVSAIRTLDDASKRVSSFLFSQLILNIGFGVVIAIGLYFIGLPYVYVWGAMAALLRYIPFLGGWISAAFPLAASLVMPDWTPFILTAAFFVVVELLQANLVEPLVFGRSIGVSGAGQLIAALFWACLWGPVGLILSTPLTACLCVLGRHFSALHYFSMLMGDDEVLEKPAVFYQRLLAGDSSEASCLVEDVLKEDPMRPVVDEMLIPALLSAQSDQKQGELTKDDLMSIAESVRDIYVDVVAPFGAEGKAAPHQDEEAQARVLVLNFPFNDEIDELIVNMLQNTTKLDTEHWLRAAVANSQLDGIARMAEEGPTLVLLATSAKRNLERIRGACRTIRKLIPDAKVLVACWHLELETDAIRARFKDAGANVVCTTFAQARQFIDSQACMPQGERSMQPA